MSNFPVRLLFFIIQKYPVIKIRFDDVNSISRVFQQVISKNTYSIFQVDLRINMGLNFFIYYYLKPKIELIESRTIS